MDRNREARRAAHMAAHPRRRHRSTSLRDSTDEDGGGEGHEQQQQQGGSRLRDRGVVMKKDRERERTSSSSRSKRRRENRVINNNNNNFNNNHNHNNNRDEIGEDSSEESVNDDEDEEDDDEVDAGNGGFKMLPPASAVLGNTNSIHQNNNSNMQHQNHNHHHHQQQNQQQIQHRKSFPPSAGKVFRSTAAAAPPLPAWKASADEMIGVSVPRKARSASTKRSHEWVSGVIGTEQSHRQNSTSPAASPAQPVAPPSPSSSSLSVRKKMKANGGVGGPSNNNISNNNKPRPPAAPKTSSAKSSSSNPEELEIEIAEVLYGLMTQSQAPSADKKDTPQSNDNKQSIVSSPTPNSTSSVVAPKRKRPRQVSENPFGVRNSPPVSSSVKNEIDHQNQNQATKNDAISAYMEHVPENGGGAAAPFGFTSMPSNQGSETATRTQPPVEEEGKCVGMVLTKEEAESTSSLVGLNEGNKVSESLIMTATAAASITAANLKAAANNPPKTDLLSKVARRKLDEYLEPDTNFLLVEESNWNSAWSKKYRKLTHALSSVIDDYSLVKFVPMNMYEEESLNDILFTVDEALQFDEEREVKPKDLDEGAAMDE